jgi:hypothetical protein
MFSVSWQHEGELSLQNRQNLKFSTYSLEAILKFKVNGKESCAMAAHRCQRRFLLYISIKCCE